MKITAKVIKEREQTILNFGMVKNENNTAYQYMDSNIIMTDNSIATLQPDVWDIAIKTIIADIERLKDVPASLGEIAEFTEVIELKTGVELIDKDKANKEIIADWKKRCESLKLTSLADKDTHKAIASARSYLRKQRTTGNKLRESMVAESVAYQRTVNGTWNVYSASIEEIEDALQAELDKWQQWKDKADLDKKEAAEKFLKDRVIALIDAGITFNGDYYSIGDNLTNPIILTIDAIKSYTEAGFASLLEAVKKQKALLDQLAEEARKEEETRKENERLERERLAEAQRKLAEEQANLQKAQKQMADDRFQLRGERCQSAGLVYSQSHMAYEFSSEGYTTTLPKDYLITADNEAFNTLLTDVTRQIKEAKEQAANKLAEENRKREQAETERIAREQKSSEEYSMKANDLINLGMVLLDTCFIRKNEFQQSVLIRINEVRATDMDMWPARLLILSDEITALNNATAQKRAEIATAKQRALPEITQAENYLKSMIEAMEGIDLPVIQTQSIYNIIIVAQSSIIESLKAAEVGIGELAEKIKAVNP